MEETELQRRVREAELPDVPEEAFERGRPRGQVLQEFLDAERERIRTEEEPGGVVEEIIASQSRMTFGEEDEEDAGEEARAEIEQSLRESQVVIMEEDEEDEEALPPAMAPLEEDDDDDDDDELAPQLQQTFAQLALALDLAHAGDYDAVAAYVMGGGGETEAPVWQAHDVLFPHTPSVTDETRRAWVHGQLRHIAAALMLRIADQDAQELLFDILVNYDGSFPAAVRGDARTMMTALGGSLAVAVEHWFAAFGERVPASSPALDAERAADDALAAHNAHWGHVHATGLASLARVRLAEEAPSVARDPEGFLALLRALDDAAVWRARSPLVALFADVRVRATWRDSSSNSADVRAALGPTVRAALEAAVRRHPNSFLDLARVAVEYLSLPDLAAFFHQHSAFNAVLSRPSVDVLWRAAPPPARGTVFAALLLGQVDWEILAALDPDGQHLVAAIQGLHAATLGTVFATDPAFYNNESAVRTAMLVAAYVRWRPGPPLVVAAGTYLQAVVETMLVGSLYYDDDDDGADLMRAAMARIEPAPGPELVLFVARLFAVVMALPPAVDNRWTATAYLAEVLGGLRHTLAEPIAGLPFAFGAAVPGVLTWRASAERVFSVDGLSTATATPPTQTASTAVTMLYTVLGRAMLWDADAVYAIMRHAAAARFPTKIFAALLNAALDHDSDVDGFRRPADGGLPLVHTAAAAWNVATLYLFTEIWPRDPDDDEAVAQWSAATGFDGRTPLESAVLGDAPPLGGDRLEAVQFLLDYVVARPPHGENLARLAGAAARNPQVGLPTLRAVVGAGALDAAAVRGARDNMARSSDREQQRKRRYLNDLARRLESREEDVRQAREEAEEREEARAATPPRVQLEPPESADDFVHLVSSDDFYRDTVMANPRAFEEWWSRDTVARLRARDAFFAEWSSPGGGGAAYLDALFAAREHPAPRGSETEAEAEVETESEAEIATAMVSFAARKLSTPPPNLVPSLATSVDAVLSTIAELALF